MQNIKPHEITKEQKKASRQWWNDLSINEMKDFTQKYYPEFDWLIIGQMPSFLFYIYQSENPLLFNKFW